MNETYIYQFESESGAGENFNFWEPFSPKFETKYFIFDETYMFRIKTEHISERVFGQVAKRHGVSCRHVNLMGQKRKNSEKE